MIWVIRKNKALIVILLYLLVIALSGLISAYSMGRSLAAIEVTGDNNQLKLDPSGAKLFEINNMYPGKMESAAVKVKNLGTGTMNLEVRLNLSIDPELEDALKLSVSDSGKVYYSGLLKDMKPLAVGSISAGSSKDLVFQLEMLAGHGNKTQNRSAAMEWVFAAT